MTSPYHLPEWAAFLARIRSNPGDDLPRLVAADWLEEHGEPDRAEFIRLQCELARSELRPSDSRNRLVRRQNRLWDAHAREWFVPPYGFVRFLGEPGEAHADTDTGWLLVRRGFFAEAQCALAEWIGGGCRQCDGLGERPVYGVARAGTRTCRACSGTGRVPAAGPPVVAIYPVERVVLTDRAPVRVEGTGLARWLLADRGYDDRFPNGCLPEGVFERLTGGVNFPTTGRAIWKEYLSFEVASTALSGALVAWAIASPGRET